MFSSQFLPSPPPFRSEKKNSTTRTILGLLRRPSLHPHPAQKKIGGRNTNNGNFFFIFTDVKKNKIIFLKIKKKGTTIGRFAGRPR